MKRFRTPTLGAAGLAALMLFPAAAFGVSEHHAAGGTSPAVESGAEGARLAHMGGGRPGMTGPAQAYVLVPCPYAMAPGMMGPGMMQGMGPGMMGPGMMGQGMNPGMMGPGMMPGMGQGMGSGMMGPGMMGPRMMNPGMMNQGQGSGMMPGGSPDADLSADDVRATLQRSLEWHGNPRLEVGDVAEADDDTITADIVTKDGSLVQRFMVDRHTGAMRPAQ